MKLRTFVASRVCPMVSLSALCLLCGGLTPGFTAQLLPAPAGLTVWWAPSSAAKIQPNTPAPTAAGIAVQIFCARNETEPAQLVLHSQKAMKAVRLSCQGLPGPNGTVFPPDRIEFLHLSYLWLERASDSQSKAGPWPDPLIPLTRAIDLEGGTNHVFWVRVSVPKQTRAGLYKGTVRVDAAEVALDLPLELTVGNFELPDRMSCATAFGFSPGEVFRYHGLKTDEQKRTVLHKYFANLAAHHVSPYDPAPLDPIQVTWPEVTPPKPLLSEWVGLRLATNEVHTGQSALLVHDDQTTQNVTVAYDPLIPIPPKGLVFRGWCRTAIPGHRFNIAFNHYDTQRQWMSGRNQDVVYSGTGQWQWIEEWLTNAPVGAAFVRLHLRATTWTDDGELLGLVWFDDLSLKDLETGTELLTGGDFERPLRTELVAPAQTLHPKLDFTRWDRAMQRAMDEYQFTSYQVEFPGLGGGTFHSIEGPSLRGFQEADPEYPFLMEGYGKQLESHLRQRGWLDRAFVYWFDEPDPHQYPFVMNGFAKLKRYAPGLTRMLTEQVEPGLFGGPNLWCPISNEYKHEPAQERRKHGEKFWWYVCTGPKAPYAGLFIDHPGPEMRVWVWQTWQRGIEGLLVWQINYWTSSAAYPDRAHPQNPYEDPMSWMSGYSTPAGKKISWGNGDGRFIYPPVAAGAANPSEPILDGPVDSIRWEHLRDGIEDYEYFRILRDRLQGAQGKKLPLAQQRQLEKLLTVPEAVSRSLTDFTRDGAALETHRRELAKAIELLGS